MYHSFGAASPEVIAQAKLAWPRCWGAEAEACHDEERPTELSCKARNDLWLADRPLYEKWMDETPYCSENPPMLKVVAAGAGGLLLGFALGFLLG